MWSAIPSAQDDEMRAILREFCDDYDIHAELRNVNISATEPHTRHFQRKLFIFAHGIHNPVEFTLDLFGRRYVMKASVAECPVSEVVGGNADDQPGNQNQRARERHNG